MRVLYNLISCESEFLFRGRSSLPIPLLVASLETAQGGPHLPQPSFVIEMIPCSFEQCQDVQDTLFHLEWALMVHFDARNLFREEQYALRLIPRSRLELIKLELIFEYIKYRFICEAHV